MDSFNLFKSYKNKFSSLHFIQNKIDFNVNKKKQKVNTKTFAKNK